MDAGTDNGFTFTAPNWPSEPKSVVEKIEANRPNHPANSFFYPNLTSLPTIATFRFIKVRLRFQQLRNRSQAARECILTRGACDSAKNHKRQSRKRQSVTAKREKSQMPKFV